MGFWHPYAKQATQVVKLTDSVGGKCQSSLVMRLIKNQPHLAVLVLLPRVYTSRKFQIHGGYQDQVAYSQQPQCSIAYEAISIIMLLPWEEEETI
jgi:hypothetical protein